jgi:hypothetical protein
MTLIAVVGSYYRTVESETVCVIHGEKSLCFTKQQPIVRQDWIEVSPTSLKQYTGPSFLRHSNLAILHTECLQLDEAAAEKRTKTANAASSELGPPWLHSGVKLYQSIFSDYPRYRHTQQR